MAPFNNVLLYTDGGSKGNPGPGSIGIVICDEQNRLLYEFSECIGHCTNNQAEYRALIRGLDLAARYTRRRVTVHSDSELVMKQMNGVYRLKNDALRGFYHEVKNRERVFDSVTYQHVPRGNQRVSQADKLNRNAHAGRPVDKCHIDP
jgi:ribonuclease HI